MQKYFRTNDATAIKDCRAVEAETTLKTRESLKIQKSTGNKIIVFVINVLFLVTASAQETTMKNKSQTLETNCLHYPYNTQVGINMNVNMLSKMEIQPLYDHDIYNHELVRVGDDLSEYFRSYPSVGTDFGVYLYQRIYKWLGIQLGIEYNLATVCYSYKFDNEDSKTVNMNYMNSGFHLPISLNASYYFNKKHGMDISLGGVSSFNWFTGGLGGHRFRMGSWEDGDYCSFGLDPMSYNYSLYIKLGYNYLFKNKNTLGIALIGHLVGSYADGKYVVRKGEKIDTGNTNSHNTSVGLQFSYGFTMKKLLCNP
jgi:hypothetical protein